MANLTAEGPLDWVHWGLYTETSLDRKANVLEQISDFTLVAPSNFFGFAYQFGDNWGGYSWSDGTPDVSVTDTTTGVYSVGLNHGFQFSVPAGTSVKTLKVYVGAYGASGKFQASLSDSSAPAYVDTSLTNVDNGPNRIYLITFAGRSPGSKLNVKWTVASMVDTNVGNVTLQAAALTAANANNPPFVELTSPADNGTFNAGANITLVADAVDFDGTISKVEFFQGTTKLGEDLASPFSFTWAGVPAGIYSVWARATDNGGAISGSEPVEIFVNTSGGAMSGSVIKPPTLPTLVNLTTEGTADWVHWGARTNGGLDRKAGVVTQISDYAAIGDGMVDRYADNYTAFSWSDGTPTASATGTPTGVFIPGVTNGFQVTLPADTTTRTAKFYVGLYSAKGEFQAWLSDYSAKAYADTSLSNFFGNSYAAYTLSYAAASAGQTLTVRYTTKEAYDPGYANVTLQSVTLAGGGGPADAPPVVTVTQPTNGTVLTAPASFTMAATASDSDGSVSQVQFFNGGTSLGIDTTSPYSVAVSSLAAGSYTLSAVATDNLGAKATNSVSIVVNNPPTAALTSPSDGASFVAPANITLAATAGDSDGTVSRVEFFEGANKLGEDTSSPYSFAWNNVAAGSYTLTAKATDNRGATTTSAPITISVGNNASPTVTITGPTNGTVLTAPASFIMAATGADSDGSVSQVQFFNGGTSLGIDTSSPYSVAVSSLAAGSYALSAVATDNLGAKATNSVSIVVNNPPTAALTSPSDGASFVAPANITLAATAADSDGTVSKVEFFEGANKLGEDTSSPYSFAWNNVAAGSYTLTVKATDNRGATALSSVVTVSVTNGAPTSVLLFDPRRIGNDFAFSFATQIGRSYEAQHKDALGSGDWQFLGTFLGDGTNLSVTNKNASGTQQFYRVESK